MGRCHRGHPLRCPPRPPCLTPTCRPLTGLLLWRMACTCRTHRQCRRSCPLHRRDSHRPAKGLCSTRTPGKAHSQHWVQSFCFQVKNLTFPSPEPETALVVLLFSNYIFFLNLSLGLGQQKDFHNVNRSQSLLCGAKIIGKRKMREKKNLCLSNWHNSFSPGS